MKSNILLFILSFFIALNKVSLGNILIPHLFSEILIKEHGWIIELDTWQFHDEPVDLDTFYLVADFTSIKITNCERIDSTIYLIRSDSLGLDNIISNPLNASSLRIISPSGDLLDEISICDLLCNNVRPGESICILGDMLYLDYTPTIGARNDFEGCKGVIRGTFTDTNGNPIPDVLLLAGYYSYAKFPMNVDSVGSFSQEFFATCATIFICDHCMWPTDILYTTVLYPYDTVDVALIYQPVTSVNQKNISSLEDYVILNNFPNPFNTITRINYQLPRDDIIEVTIYDLTGRLVEKLFSGYQAKGKYSLIWDAFDAPSGIYIYQLRTSKFVKSKKCLLIK